ncbi:MAG: hypothetical protein COZ29_02165 [Candidatus Moranbacteria bacterium CG_4_10_14_3_um_filter_45_9]|nr:MAG: hypothetical protein AUK19_01400 [Candidatus Moranbacteria bacterium CG2_30_45_14]PIX90025.1 MAG: hypothetical protein COZ29_02165 [Candidatus Moranbacteria bacterium CG_4_10_14_3_um_filter_45_9]PJA85287.1 MAG: hypothetical protein CO143_01985 [Candidatus Moranbacteria bacterium CG_4_9_14_3_um_filter_45_14]
MLDKKRQEKIKGLVELEKVITEILVANGRTVEPFIKVFNYSDENITKSPLGSLIGVFEIAEQSEDSAYIVNFLASVAKKEYFSNGRRGAIESFEAALHKINLALAELVRHGNIAWLGNFHGALGVLEKNNLHFSITGKSEILLLRGEKISEISAGLASPESNIHPIKTFVEISSGHLMLEDKIIFTSPELLDLLSIEDLKKNALRMDKDQFAQFLRTVLVNELNMGGSLIVDLKESTPLPEPRKETRKVTTVIENIFSKEAFDSQIKPKENTDQLPEKEEKYSNPKEYVDSKTGHIFIQGETSGEAPEHLIFERAKLSAQDLLHIFSSFFASQGKLIRKGKKYGLLLSNTLAEKNAVITHKMTRFLRKQWQKGMTASTSGVSSLILSLRSVKISQKAKKKVLPDTITTSSYEETLKSRLTFTEKRAEDISSLVEEKNEDIPDFMKEKLARFYRENTAVVTQIATETYSAKKFQTEKSNISVLVRKIFQRIPSSSHMIWNSISSQAKTVIKSFFPFLRTLSSRYQKRTFIFSILFVVLFITGSVLLTRSFLKNTPSPLAEISQPPIETSVFPLETEKNAHVLETSPLIIATEQDPLIASILLGNETYLITTTSIQNTNDNKRYPLPSGAGAIQFASPMDDLRLIFVYTNTNELFSFAPVNHTFTKNTLTLPANALVEDIGTYLTYLYVLDSATDQIYRFPRAEGGFGAGSTWFRNTIDIEDTAQMAINETIFIAPNKATVSAFFRGQFVKNLESPVTPLSLTSLFTHPGLTDIYALDAENKRVLIWNQDSTLLAQYFSEQFASAESITVNEKTGEFFLTTSNTLLSFKINLGE